HTLSPSAAPLSRPPLLFSQISSTAPPLPALSSRSLHAALPIFIGATVGTVIEFDIDKAFPGENKGRYLGYTNDDNVTGTVRYTVEQISRRTPAAVDQEFFDKIFGKDVVKDEETFRTRVRESLTEDYQREAKHFTNHLIEDHFVENTKIELPDEFLKTWLRRSAPEITDELLDREFKTYR